MGSITAGLQSGIVAALRRRSRFAGFAMRHAPLLAAAGAALIAVSIFAAAAIYLPLLFGYDLLADSPPGVLAAAVLAVAVAVLIHDAARRIFWMTAGAGAPSLADGSGFAILARNAPVGIFQADPSGSCLYVNPKWCEIAGITAEEASGEGWAQALHPDDCARVGAEWYACARERRPFRCEYRFQHPDGKTAWVLGQAEARRDKNGKTIGYYGTITEITQSKETEKVLRRTNRALEVVSACNAALVRVTDENELLSEICRIIVETGQHRMAWVGFAENDELKTVRPAAKAGHEDGYLDEIKVYWADREGGRGPAGLSIRSGKPYVVRDTANDPAFVHFRHAALARGFASLVCFPLHDASRVFGILAIYSPDKDAFDEEEVRLLGGLADNLAYGIGALRTRSEHAKAEETIRESEERFRATFEQAAVGMSHVSPDGRYLRVNQKFCDITGYARSELLGRSSSDITHPDDIGRDAELRRRMLRGEIPISAMEKRYVRKDGTVVWVNRTISAVCDSAGEPKYFISVVQDITAAKKLETQLRQAQKMEAVGQLTGGVAHDFNNLLTVVLGNLELLSDRPGTDAKTRELASHAIAAAERGAYLTQRLLAFSRKQLLQPQMTDVNRLVAAMHDLLRRSLGEVVRVETHLAANPSSTMVDPGQLETAILNLAVNARDAMPGGGQITIETATAYLDNLHSVEDDDVVAGEYLMVSVADTGTGMSREVRDRAFEPFFTTKEVGKGTGLGLSMIYGFVRQSGGYVGISSEPGRGTTVRVYLPYIGAAANPAA